MREVLENLQRRRQGRGISRYHPPRCRSGARMADALWEQLEDTQLQASLRQRFTDMHHTLLRDTAQLASQAVLDVIAAHKAAK